MLVVIVLLGGVLACNRGHVMTPWNGLKVPGMELFVERGAGGHDAVPVHGAARIDGRRAVLTGKAAFDAARARIGDDPTALATLSMLFLDDQVDGVVGRTPWTRPLGAAASAEEALAAPPRVTGTTLEYWRPHAMLANLVRCRVVLATGAVTCQLATEVIHDQQLAADPYKLVDEELASDNVNDWRLAVADLVKIGDDKARQRLVDLALDAYWPKQREAAAEALGRLPGPGVVEALERVEKLDKSQDVSMAAYRSLLLLRGRR